MSTVSMQDLLNAGIHFGHQKRYWNPQMEPYIFGVRNKIHIIDLQKTLPMFEEALNFVSRKAAEGGTVLFVGTKKAAGQIIKEQAERCGMPYVSHRWLGGMLTNFKTIKQSINRLKDLESSQVSGGFNKLTKKEALVNARKLEKLNLSLGGIKDMQGMPDVIFVIDVRYERTAIKEAKSLAHQISVVGVVDTNCSTNGIDYVIPGNDDAFRAIRLYATALADAVITGQQKGLGEQYFEEADEGKVDESPRPAIATESDSNVEQAVAEESAAVESNEAELESQSETTAETTAEATVTEPESQSEVTAEEATAAPK